MASKRSDAQERVTQVYTMFERYIGKQMTIAFDSFCFPITITAIALAKLTDIENKPDYRHDDTGKRYRPPIMIFTTDVGELQFVIEDITIAALYNGVQITVGTTTIQIRIANETTTGR